MSELLPGHRHHPRELDDHRYVYAVLSRRARGVSVGVNLSPHKGCNFDCTYCQVDRTTPGPETTVDLAVLRAELRRTFDLAQTGELFTIDACRGAPEELRRLADVALSGDGEPTNETWFPEAARIVAEERTRAGFGGLPYRIITNATTFHRPAVADTLRLLDAHSLDVWAKLDAGTAAYYEEVDRTRVPFDRVLENLTRCAQERVTTIQALFVRHHGTPPSEAELDAWGERLADIRRAGGRIGWVQVHTVSRAPAEGWVTGLTLHELEAIAARARAALPDARVEAYRGSA